MSLVAQEGPARVVEQDGKYEVSMYGMHVKTFDNEEQALIRMRKEAGIEARYVYK